MQQRPALTVSRDRPADPTINQLISADLSRERAVRLVEHVLRGHFNAFP